MKWLLFCSAAMLCIFASCQKSERQMIIGKWRATSVAYDTNRNGILEANEKYYTKANENAIYTFKKNGDLHYSDGTYDGDLKWELKDEGKTLIMTVDGEVTTSKVLILDNTDLKLEYMIADLEVLTQVELKKQ